MRGGASASKFISRESGGSELPSTRCVKGKHVLHSETQGSLKSPYLGDEVLSSPGSQDAGLCTSPNKPVGWSTRATTAPQPGQTTH